MADRKALLIGVAHFGPGFPPLPAAGHDALQLSQALTAIGYETQICSEGETSSATTLDRTIRAFCAEGGPDDVRIVYYSGHGLHVDGVDWVLSSGVGLQEAKVSSSQRVSTDLSATVADSQVGLVLFIVDACRDLGDDGSAGGSGAWSQSRGLARPEAAQFVRFFGCAAHEICQVIEPLQSPEPETVGEPATSLFTQALIRSLQSQDTVSLEALRRDVERRCDELLASQRLLAKQTPHLNHGETNSAQRALLDRAIFDPVGTAALGTLWARFDPTKMHILVLLSEHAVENPTDWGLDQLVQEAALGKSGGRLWQAFRRARHGQRSVAGTQRRLPESFSTAHMVLDTVTVLHALANAQTLEHTVRALAEADLVVFDVTGFEPGVMLLAGIRSACRRGLSICSHGGQWTEGSPIDVPFNLQDLNLNSHSASEQRTGDDPVVQRFVHRVETGFHQLMHQPDYQDLPGYDALRRLGPDYAASSTIRIEDQLLVLCSFDREFQSNWRFLRAQIDQALARQGVAAQRIERIIDCGSPQLVLQGLFEQLRRTAACIVDWSGFRASVFLELGVRLAVNERGAVQMVDSRYLPGGARALAEEAAKPDKPPLPKRQIERLLRLFSPHRYPGLDAKKAAFDAVAADLLQRSPAPQSQPFPRANRVYRALLDCLDLVQDALKPIALDLQQRADALHHPDQGKVGAPQVLHAANARIKQDAEGTAREMRIAAWLYLEHRIGAKRLLADPVLAEQRARLGRAAMDALYDLGDDESLDMAQQIEASLKKKE